MGSDRRTQSEGAHRCEESDLGDTNPDDLAARLLNLEDYQSKKVRFSEKWLPPGEEKRLETSTDVMVDPETGRVRLRAWPETRCKVDYETGEILCNHPNAVPNRDCRNPYCLHRDEMIARTRRRLNHLGFAPEQNLNGAVSFLRKGTVDETTLENIRAMRRAKARLRWQQEDER